MKSILPLKIFGVRVKRNSCRKHPCLIENKAKHDSPRGSFFERDEFLDMNAKEEKTIALAEEMKSIVDNVISSYEARIQSIEPIFDTTNQLLQGFQVSFLDTKKEREKITLELRESLAKQESLRKKDFDNMMQGLVLTQDEKEKEVRGLFDKYLNEQKEIAQTLRNNLKQFRDSLAKGEIQRIKEFQAVIGGIFAEQEKRKKEVSSKLKEFQKGQQEMSKKLKTLLSKGRELRIKDFKEMIKEFEFQRKQRIVSHQKRKKEIRDVLDNFNKQRKESFKNRPYDKKSKNKKLEDKDILSNGG